MTDTLPRKYRLTFYLLVDVPSPESLECSSWDEVETSLVKELGKALEFTELLDTGGGVTGSLKFVQMTRRAV